MLLFLSIDIFPQYSPTHNTDVLMEMALSGSTALVTGGTGALGKVIVERIFDQGLNVCIPYKSERSLAGLPARVTRDAARSLTAMTDLTLSDEVDAFVGSVAQKFRSVEYLILAAGGYMGGDTIDEVGVDDWNRIMDLNLKASFLMSRAVLRIMKQHRFGRIVSIAAMPALAPSQRRGPYAISKRGVITLTETIAEETKGTGITANAIAPSIIDTEANRQSMPDADFSRWVTPGEIADLALYLCSDEARSVSGNVIRIFGGV